MRGHRPQRLPGVLTENEVRRVLSNLQGTPALVAQILYGSGLRLMKALCLRIKDVDFEKNSIMVRDGKGDKDRITMLPESLKASLQSHLSSVYALHRKYHSNATTSMPARYRLRCVQQC
ncbi:MAG: tyrosine-type recombinase/integrase, partial [bacterium]